MEQIGNLLAKAKKHSTAAIWYHKAEESCAVTVHPTADMIAAGCLSKSLKYFRSLGMYLGPKVLLQT